MKIKEMKGENKKPELKFYRIENLSERKYSKNNEI
jgi:hypothetical protein